MSARGVEVDQNLYEKNDPGTDRQLMPYRGELRTPVAPAYRVPADQMSEMNEASQDSMLAEYLHVVLRQRWLIAGFGVAGLLLAILLQINTQSVYQARTSLEVQAVNGDFLDSRSVAPTAVLPSDVVLQTQVKLLASESLADRVQEKLQHEPHDSEVSQNDLLSRLAGRMGTVKAKQISYETLLDATAKSVKVKPIGVSQLIEVTCDSWDAKFAATYCNSLTSEFQNADLESRGSQAKHISDFLVRQASDVRLKAEESQRNLERAAGGNGLLLQQQTDTIGQDRLKEMQTELVHAEADRMEKQAELSEAQSGSSESVPDTTAYASSNARVADLQAQVAALMPPLTEANPKIIHLRAQIAEVQANMQREKGISTGKLQGAYQAAKHREDLLRMSYQTMESGVSSDIQKSSEIEILRREVQSEQQLYQTLLQRAKEAGFASAMPASTIRVVDSAHIPHIPIYPRRLTTAAVGVLIGVGLGVLLGFVIERHSPRLRVPGDIDRLVRVGELGVIPSDDAHATLSQRLMRPVKSSLIRLNQTASTPRQNGATWSEEALVAEAYRSTTMSLLLNERDRRSRIFVVSSPNPGEGKTTVVANLAIALSKARLRVVLVDGDLRKSRLHQVLNVENTLGLRNLLSEGVETYAHQMDLVCKPTEYENLSVIPSGAGRESVADLLHSPQLGILMQNLAAHYDVVLIDSPPMLHITDARILAGDAHSVILVLRSGETKLSNAIAVRNMLDRDRVRIAGSVLNDFNPRREGRARYYTGYYEYQGEARAS